MAYKIAAVERGSAVDPCCCEEAVCNVIAYSLCGTAPIPCGFPEFTDPEADPPVTASCPPKFYKTKTVIYESFKKNTSSFDYSEGYLRTVKKYTLEVDADGICRETIECVSGTCYDRFGNPQVYIRESTQNADCSWTGTITYAPTSEHPEGEVLPWDTSYNPDADDPPLVEVSKTSMVHHYDYYPYPDIRKVKTITATLSDEIPLEEILRQNVCDEDHDCDPTEDEGCEPCCTGDEASGRKWLSTPTGCVTPGSSGIAFYIGNPCDGSNLISGQSSTLSLWFKDLEVGAQYKASITYARCEFEKDEEENYLVPSCSTGVPCKEGVENTLLDPVEITFEAENWAEIFSARCGHCDIEHLKCTLEDEAETWNSEHEEEPPRTVGCTSGGLSVPASPHHYTWLHSCSLEKLETPP